MASEPLRVTWPRCVLPNSAYPASSLNESCRGGTRRKEILFHWGGSTALQVEYASCSRGMDSQQILSFYMGKNTPERKDYIMENLVVTVEE